LVHVHTISGKTSYKYYRLASKAIFAVIKEFGFPLEKRGMDEAYLDVSSAISDIESGVSSLLEQASGIAARMKSAVETKTGYICSCGVATNKLLAKLSSRKAKPNGVSCIHDEDWVSIARGLRVESLPQCGGQIAEILAERFKAITCAEASAIGLDDLVESIGLKKAHLLYESCRGQDPSPVVATAAAKSLQSQCSITPLVLVQHEGTTGLDDNHLGLLEPTPPWSVDRIGRIVDILANDLAERIEEDAEENNRHATSLTLSLQMFTCSPTEVGHFGIPCAAPAGAAASRVRPSHVSQVYEGAVVVWPSHQFVPAIEHVAPPEPALVWTRAATELVKKTGQVTSRSTVFPLDAYEDGRSTAARATSILQSAQKIYLAAALAAADSDGWWWNGLTCAASKTVLSCFPQHDFQQSSDGTVPGVGGAGMLGKIDWMSHPLGTSSSNSTLKSWVNRFTLPLSVVKIALAATNFKAGPPPQSVLKFLMPRTHLSPTRFPESPERVTGTSKRSMLPTNNSAVQGARASAERNRDTTKRTTQMTLAGQKRLREASTPPTPEIKPFHDVEVVVLASQSSGEEDVQFVGAEESRGASPASEILRFPAKLSQILQCDLRAGGTFITPDFVTQVWKSVS
jgi:nucleotidyltransferase/DNA polymerase involved in DNA repair